MARGQWEPGSMTTKEAGRRGGAARKETMTPQAYAEIGRKGGQTTRDRYGKGHYAQLGKEGGDALLRQRGREYYTELGRKGGRRTHELLTRGRALEAGDEAE